MSERIEDASRRREFANPRDPGGLRAFIIYSAFSLLVFGRPLLTEFRDASLGSGATPVSLMWALVWWPTAALRGLNPFVTTYIWAPIGINLTWATAIPLPSIIMWPITRVFGPVVAYNVLGLVSAPLAGWSAFLLCRYLSKSWWASLIGGQIFGFSSYLLNELWSGDRHLTLVFLIPLISLVAIRDTFTERRRPVSTIATLAVMLAAEPLISTEVFASMTLFGAIVLAFSWLSAPSETRARITALMLSLSAAYVAAVIFLSPFVYWLFAFGFPHGAIWPESVERYYSSLWSFVLPTRFHALHPVWVYGVASWYVGLPIIGVVAHYAWNNYRSRLGCMLLASLFTICTFSLGAHLRLYGSIILPLPGAILLHLPLIDKALPNRFMMYGFLLLSIIVSIWFSSNKLSTRTNAVVAGAIIVATFPCLSFPWAQPIVHLPFFSEGYFNGYLKRGENVLVFPFGGLGDSMLWAADSNIYFRLVGGWTEPHPSEFDEWPIRKVFSWIAFQPDAADQFGAFMEHHEVEVAVVADNSSGAEYWRGLLSKFSNARFHAGGVTVDRILPSALEPYRAVTSAEMRQRAAKSAIESLLQAAAHWSATGRSFAGFDPARALESGGLKESWCAGEVSNSAVDAVHHWFCGIEIGGTTNGNVRIGLPGAYADLKPVIDRYRNFAHHIFFPFPRDLLSPTASEPAANEQAFLELEFTPAQIAAIAPQLHASSH
ncbi:MAG TPA: hypothetical protein VMU16_01185 [Candidatus Binataceae bacterium]|nr:hypothetical protein [Candidatus Binataceae bacterium]